MLFFSKEYFPKHNSNRLSSEGDCINAREILLKKKPRNLIFLLEKRYAWMNKFLNGKDKIFEIGCGAGMSKFFINNKKLVLTDVTHFDWVDKYEDALNLSFEKESIDVFLCSHMIHHLSNPKRFLNQAIDCLKPGGLIVISDVNLSFALKFILRLTQHEGWSYKPNVFSEATVCNSADDPWSGNNAIPQLLFKDKSKFEEEFRELNIIHFKLAEFLILPISGGVIAKAKTIQLPNYFLRIIDKFDKLLIKILPNIFAMGMEVVLEKKYKYASKKLSKKNI